VIAPPLLTAGATTNASLPRLQRRPWSRPTLDGRGSQGSCRDDRAIVYPTYCRRRGRSSYAEPVCHGPQERDAPESATRAASPEIQEVGESSGAALPRDVRGSDARVLELARVPWAAAFEIGNDVKDDE
jgi:hypothetical protein